MNNQATTFSQQPVDQKPTNQPSQLQKKAEKEPVKQKKMLPHGIPEQYFTNEALNRAIQILPPHYNFQIYKTLHRIDTLAIELKKQQIKASLQFPEGLMLFACVISDILKQFSKCRVSTVIMADVTYGACCVDDLASDQMNCDLLVHYGHSCLIPITQTKRKVLYIFVEIQIDINHFVETVKFNFEALSSEDIYLMGTIQFNNSLFLAKQALADNGFGSIIIPQQKPRSGGQVLGCTSPKLQLKPKGRHIVIFLCDGRFHMEAVMISNPLYQFYQYDPYSRSLTEQKYATDTMLERRRIQIQKAKQGKSKRMCFIFGALGRQGNTGILDRLTAKVQGVYEYMVLIASQINSELLTLIEVDFFVQIACPRLSIDWAFGTPKPLLTTFELYALIEGIKIQQNYSMDYYSLNGGPWANFYGKTTQKKSKQALNGPKLKLQLQKKQQGCCNRQQQGCLAQMLQCCNKSAL